MSITEKNIKDAEPYDGLGPVYFSARDAAQRFMEQWEPEHLEPLVDTIAKAVREKVWEDFEFWLLSDTEMNVAGQIRHQVEDVVKAIIGGQDWALKRYPLAQGYDGERIRSAIFEHVGDEMRNDRIADLEKEIGKLKKQLEYARC